MEVKTTREEDWAGEEHLHLDRPLRFRESSGYIGMLLFQLVEYGRRRSNVSVSSHPSRLTNMKGQDTCAHVIVEWLHDGISRQTSP